MKMSIFKNTMVEPLTLEEQIAICGGNDIWVAIGFIFGVIAKGAQDMGAIRR